MKTIKNFISEQGRLRAFLVFYLLFQPLIDIATSLFVKFDISSLTPGVVLRAVFVMAVGVYILFFYKGSHRRPMCIYTLCLLLYVALFMAYQIKLAGTAEIFTNVKGLLKIVYLPVVTLAIYAVWQKTRDFLPRWVLPAVALTYITSIILSIVTNTSFRTYTNLKGYRGWFFAGNEIGTIISVLCPVILLWCTSIKKWYKYIPMLMVAFISNYIGTKLVFVIVVCYIVFSLLWSLAAVFISRDRTHTKRTVLAAVMCVITLAVFVLYSPAYQNITGNFVDGFESKMNAVYEEVVVDEKNDDITVPEYITVNPSFAWKVLNWLLSDRLQGLQLYINESRFFTVPQRLLGMGYSGLPEKKALEMDLCAYYFQNGIIGSVILSLPTLAMLAYVLWTIIFKFKSFIVNINQCTFGYSFLVMVIAGAFTGHVLVAPAVSIYLPILFFMFLNEREAPDPAALIAKK